MADYEHGDYNWADDISSIYSNEYNQDEAKVPQNYDQITEGYDVEYIQSLTKTVLPVSTTISSLNILYEYLTSTHQSCFTIEYDSVILATGFVEIIEGEYKLTVYIDDSPVTSCEPWLIIDSVLQSLGNTPLSYRQRSLDFIYIPWIHKSWSQMFEELTRTSPGYY